MSGVEPFRPLLKNRIEKCILGRIFLRYSNEIDHMHGKFPREQPRKIGDTASSSEISQRHPPTKFPNLFPFLFNRKSLFQLTNHIVHSVQMEQKHLKKPPPDMGRLFLAELGSIYCRGDPSSCISLLIPATGRRIW